MYDKDELDRIKQMQEDWEAATLKEELKNRGERKEMFETRTGIPLQRVYGPRDLEERGIEFLEVVGFPGDFPFTRGISPTM